MRERLTSGKATASALSAGAPAIAVALERTNATGLAHLDGTLSMARSAPDTATGSFSIVIGDQPEMNHGGKRNPDGQGFAAFGRVVSGMDVVRAIQRSPTGQKGAYGTETRGTADQSAESHQALARSVTVDRTVRAGLLQPAVDPSLALHAE